MRLGNTSEERAEQETAVMLTDYMEAMRASEYGVSTREEVLDSAIQGRRREMVEMVEIKRRLEQETREDRGVTYCVTCVTCLRNGVITNYIGETSRSGYERGL